MPDRASLTPPEAPRCHTERVDDFLSIKAAAAEFDVSRATLQRRSKDGTLEAVGAFRDKQGTWRIPRTGLAQIGYRLRHPEADPMAPSEHPVEAPDTARLREELDQLRERAARAETRAGIAEAVAAERSEQISDLRRSLALLEASKPQPAVPAPEQPAPEPAADQPEQPAPAVDSEHPASAPSGEGAAQRRGGFWRRVFSSRQ